MASDLTAPSKDSTTNPYMFFAHMAQCKVSCPCSLFNSGVWKVKHIDYRKQVVWHNDTNMGLLIKGTFTFFCMLGRFSNSFAQ